MLHDVRDTLSKQRELIGQNANVTSGRRIGRIMEAKKLFLTFTGVTVLALTALMPTASFASATDDWSSVSQTEVLELAAALKVPAKPNLRSARRICL